MTADGDDAALEPVPGYPHLDEAYWFGEGVLPILRRRGRWQHPAPDSEQPVITATPFAPTSGPAQPAAAS